MAKFLKYSPAQPRDDHGRFTSEGADAMEATLSPNRDAGIRANVRDLGRAAAMLLHQKAADLAAKAKHVVTSTRLAAIAPTAGGGVEVAATHGLPSGQGHIRSYMQIAPHMLPHPAAQRALSAVSHGLMANSVRAVPTKMPPIGAEYRNGPAPTENFGKRRDPMLGKAIR